MVFSRESKYTHKICIYHVGKFFSPPTNLRMKGVDSYKPVTCQQVFQGFMILKGSNWPLVPSCSLLCSESSQTSFGTKKKSMFLNEYLVSFSETVNNLHASSLGKQAQRWLNLLTDILNIVPYNLFYIPRQTDTFWWAFMRQKYFHTLTHSERATHVSSPCHYSSSLLFPESLVGESMHAKNLQILT